MFKTIKNILLVSCLGLVLAACTNVEEPVQTMDVIGDVEDAFAIENSAFAFENGEHEIIYPEVSSTDGAQQFIMTVDGVERSFLVYKPENLEEGEEVPVVFMFHGSGGSGPGVYKSTSWKDKADDEGFVVVYPTGLSYRVYKEENIVNGELVEDFKKKQTKWSRYGLERILDPEFDQEVINDIPFVLGMVDFINDYYDADSDRFYATGFSNGAQFTARLAIEMTDVFAAYAPAGAGRQVEEVLNSLNDHPELPFKPRPVSLMVGEIDPKLTHSLGIESFPLDETSTEDGNPVKDFYITPYLELLGLEDSVEYELYNKAAVYSYTENTDQDAELAFTFIVVEGMGHRYPSGNTQFVNSVDIFWDFFSENSL